MSLYHRPEYVSHYPPPGYGSGPIPPPVHMPAHYGYRPPPPPPPQPAFSDANTFRRDYAARLSELSINSRQIIQDLSMMAQDYSHFADIVAQCLEAHIRRVPAWMKLPAFYLLDAISKNVFNPYAEKFAQFVVPLFLDTYGQVDGPTRSKMEEMLSTWKRGAPNGRELFGLAAQLAIERSIWGSAPVKSSARAPQPSRDPRSNVITKAQVLGELEVTLAQKERALQSNPFDSTAKGQIGVLHQLRDLVERGRPQDELAQILGQLRAMAQESAVIPPPPALPPMNSVSTQSIYGIVPPGPVRIPSHIPTMYPSAAAQPAPQSHIPAPIPTQPLSIPTAVSSSSAPGVVPDISSLFTSLIKAGLVPASSSSTPSNAGVSTKHQEQQVQVDAKLDAQREYAKTILSRKIKLTTAEITKQRPFVIPFLYERQPVQCKQCALRFSDSTAGKKLYEEHLDMHFRQNRRASQNIGRGHSRSWFVGTESWTQDVKGDGHQSIPSTKSNDASPAEREEKLRASVVVIPANEAAKSVSCPVCKETIQAEFMEDDEEWVWRNAVRVKDKIFHATCREEMKSSTSLATRLLNEAGISLGSRSGTPELSNMDSSRQSRTPPSVTEGKHGGNEPIPATVAAMALLNKMRVSKSPTPDRILAGSKRKAESDEPVGSAHESSPPLKKVAQAA